MNHQDGPLRGVRVLDLSRVLAGPYCTQAMADAGAEVIKVEPPGGDETRRYGPPFVEGEATYFLSVNRGKRSICVDLKSGDGRQVVYDLVQNWADVVVQNFRPGSDVRLGVEPRVLRKLSERLICATISGFGREGVDPYTNLPGYDLVIQGVGGVPSLTGPVDGPPSKMGTSVADLVAGLNALGGILAALYARERTGQGCELDISMFDGQLSLLSYHASAWLNAQQAPARYGNAHPSLCPYETFAAADGYLNVACANDDQFRRLAQALEQGHWCDDPRFSSNAARVAHRQVLVLWLQEHFAAHPVAHWVRVLGDAGVVCGPILDVPQALDHPQARARQRIVSAPHPSLGEVRGVASALGFENVPQAAPPRLGEHTRDVLEKVLGYDPEKVTRLCQSGAVSQLGE